MEYIYNGQIKAENMLREKFKKIGLGVLVLILSMLLQNSSFAQQNGQKMAGEITVDNISWPEVESEQRPWSRWWWMGNAVDKENITWHLEELNEAGIGGVEITPIYGVKGYEDQSIEYLSPEWMEMLNHTVAEAERLGMKVDMILGTGWPFGGTWVDDKDGARKVIIKSRSVSGGDNLQYTVEHVNERNKQEAPLHAIIAYSPSGEVIDLSGDIDQSGTLSWTAPAAQEEWTVFSFFGGWTNQQVKRSAPGGVGNVIDHFSDVATENYLNKFDQALAGSDDGIIRAFFNDSYEVYGADWTYDLFDQFEHYQGYDLKDHIPSFLGLNPGDDGNDRLAADEKAKRVRSDYYETIHHMALDRFAKPWINWTHTKGSIARQQAHGFPGNLLDFYGVTDIPEMEIFGQAQFEIPGLRQNEDLNDIGRSPSPLILKFASSAAHVEGKPLVSSESATWLDEHFRVSLSQVKPHLDLQMVAGINHMIYHGTTYSPKDEEWPGWLFYASSNFAPSNTFWKDFEALNQYMGASQSVLQQGQPDNDILLYFPMYDLWHKAPSTGGGDVENSDNQWSRLNNLFQLTVHNLDEWYYGTPFEKISTKLWDRGYTFDYISDRQILGTEPKENTIATGNTSYKTVVVPRTDHMPLETLQKLMELAESGSTVIFKDELPASVPGYNEYASRNEKLSQILKELDFQPAGNYNLMEATVGSGRVIFGNNIEYLLDDAGIKREPVVDLGVEFIRRSIPGGSSYFLSNLYGEAVDQWVPLGSEVSSAIIMDPLTKKKGVAGIRTGENGSSEVRIQLKPGESLILQTYQSQNISGENWVYGQPANLPQKLEGTWEVSFTEGGPEKPEDIKTDNLASWTELGGDKAKRYSGTASYSLTFDRPEVEADYWVLDLGTVKESARVSLNGKKLGTVFSHPFELQIEPEMLKSGENILELEVTNLMANRIAWMDSQGVEWKKFHDINIVNLDYRPFDASDWLPMQSGLIGPVTLIPHQTSAEKISYEGRR